MKEILTMHAKLYPKMRVQDAVKLVYQNEFGPGHFIPSPERALEYLKKEMEITPSNPALPLFTEIGNGLVRVNLAAMTEYRMTPEFLCEAFVKSANTVKGNISSFKEKLSVLSELVREENVFSFGTAELENYLAEYEMAGFVPVSHTKEYRENYAPAYRVVIKDLIATA